MSKSSSGKSRWKKKQKLDSSSDISANACQPTISGDISQTLSLFKCCVCLEYINPPILQCQNSHVFCQLCRRQFPSPALCPACREPLPKKDGRSYSLEQIAQSLGLQFPCKYKTYGCDVTSLLTERLNHERLCNYGPFECPDVSEECHWSGSREKVVKHLIDEHKYPIRHYGCDYSLIKLDEEDRRTSWQKLLSYKNENFVYVIKLDSDRKNHFKAIVLFIGEQREANQFRYKIEVINESDGTRLQWEDKPISIKNDIKKILSFGQNSGLNLDHNTISRLLYDNTFYINVTISNNTDI